MILTWWMSKKLVLLLEVPGHWYEGVVPNTNPQFELLCILLPNLFFEASVWINTWPRWFWMQSFPFKCCKFDIHQSSSSFAKPVNFTFIWNDFFNSRDCICNCWRFRICKRAGTTAWMVDDKKPRSLVNFKIDVQFLHSSWTFCTFCKGSERESDSQNLL